MCLLAICIASLEKCLFKHPFFDWVVCCFDIELHELFVLILKLIPCQLLYLQLFSPILRAVFLFVYGFIC